MFIIYLFLFFILYIVVRGVQLWWRLRKMLRGGGMGDGRQQGQQYRGEGVYTDEQKAKNNKQPKKKVIEDDEGEYVDFEEVK